MKLILLFAVLISAPALARDPLVHGLWVWKTPSVLEATNSVEELKNFCQTNGVNEVYVSVPAKEFTELEKRLPLLVTSLHAANIRVEALLDSIDADKSGIPRERMLEQVKGIVRFNLEHTGASFDGIHLDIEPQQRVENKGPGNLAFLSGLAETLRAVRSLANAAHLTTNADIPNKLLKGGADQRKLLLSSVEKVTLMLYELSNPDEKKSKQEKLDKLRTFSGRYLQMAYADLDDRDLAHMIIALRRPDYLELLPEMLKSLDTAHAANPAYLGWALHAYNDYLNSK